MNTPNGFVQKFRITAKDADGTEKFLYDTTRWATIDKAARFIRNGYTVSAIDSWQKNEDGSEGYRQDFGKKDDVLYPSMELLNMRMGTTSKTRAVSLENAEVVSDFAAEVKELGRQASKGSMDLNLVAKVPSSFFTACKALGIDSQALVAALIAEYPEAGGTPRRQRHEQEATA